MQANVGRTDRMVRSIVGPALGALGIVALRRGNLVVGVLGVAVGAIVLESAVTCVSALNAALGVDTRVQDERLRDSRNELRAESTRVAEVSCLLDVVEDAVRLA